MWRLDRTSGRPAAERAATATLVRISQERGTTDPGTPAEHTALVLTALGPAFLHQLAFGPGLDAPTFTQGLRALTRG